MAPSTVERKIAAVKSFHAYLIREGLTDVHPTVDVTLPKVPSRLPDVISIDDALRLLSQPFPEGPVGYRDRAVLETLYGCGLRVSELTGLDLADIDLDGGFIRVLGKGSKERLVPIAGEAVSAIEEYLKHGRPFLRAKKATRRPDPDALFLNVRGGRFYATGGVRYRARLRCESRTAVAPAHTSPFVRYSHAARGVPSCGRCRRCSAMPTSARRRSTPTWIALMCARSTSPRTRALAFASAPLSPAVAHGTPRVRLRVVHNSKYRHGSRRALGVE